ncbi:O-antigen ligase family protein [Jatrophihabitans sp. YIM 134969]
MAVTAFLLVATRQNFIVPFTGLGQGPAQLLALVLTAAWGLTRLRGGRGVPYLLAWRIAVGTYLLAGVASYVNGMADGLSSEVITASDIGLVTRVAVTGFAVLVVEVVRTRRQLEIVVGAVVVAGVVSALAGLAQFVTGVDVGNLLKLPGLQALDTGIGVTALRAGYARASGSASVPLEFGAVMTVLVPLAVTLFLVARRRRERAWPWAVAALLLVAAGGVSLSRSVFVGIAVAFVVLAVGWPVRRTGAVLLAAACAAVVAWLAAGGIVSDLVGLVTRGSGDYSLQSRTDGRSYVLQRVLEHTWFGQGIGTYQTGVQPVLDNQYLSELVETGLVGVVAFVLVFVVTFVLVSWARAVDPDPDGRDLAAGLSAALAVVATVNLVIDTAGFAQILLLGWLVVGLCGAATHLSVVSHRQFGDQSDRRVGDRPATT